MAQLVAGCLLASAMLALTALLRPYKHFGDDILAIGCQAAVVANLALAILLRNRRAESDLRRLAFTTDTAADAAYAEAVELDLWEESIAHGLIAAAVTPIVGAVVLAVAQLRRAPSRTRSSSFSSHLGLRRRPARPRARRRRNVGRAASRGERRGARTLARQPTLLRDLSGCHRPPLAAPPVLSANERWRAAGLAVTAVSHSRWRRGHGARRARGLPPRWRRAPWPVWPKGRQHHLSSCVLRRRSRTIWSARSTFTPRTMSMKI